MEQANNAWRVLTPNMIRKDGKRSLYRSVLMAQLRRDSRIISRVFKLNSDLRVRECIAHLNRKHLCTIRRHRYDSLMVLQQRKLEKSMAWVALASSSSS
ncbi:hypothetical protein OBBRIDRAFT_797329 [Obba rivulosa]|uniref:Uncharacterized protein n=1 Tax=Obba rivulosa TaxID=1052685 RepID=A0A8E2DFS4_9APHY|nr:hypothetical protein OBBRIDRAFT_797329 [Obba rivulosa]